MSYTTTFGIDVTKKCFPSPGGKTAEIQKHTYDKYGKPIKDTNGEFVNEKVSVDLSRSWAMGSIAEDCLKNISVTYEEKFGAPYAGQVRDAYEKAISGVVKTIKKSVKVVQALANGEAITNAVSESGGTGSDGQTLQSLLLEYGTAVAAAQTAAGEGTKGANELSSLISGAIAVPSYNIPTRAEIPGLALGFGNSIKINFQFGSAGIFNAKEEVYDPIKNIMASFQKFASAGSGMVTASTNGVPWEVGGMMARAETYGKFSEFSPSLSTLSTTIKNLATSTTKFGKAASKVIEAKVGLDALYNKVESNDAGAYIEKNYLVSNEDGVKIFDLELFNTSHIKESALTSMQANHYKDDGSNITWNDDNYKGYLKKGYRNQLADLVSKGKSGVEEMGKNAAKDVWSSLAVLASAEPSAVAKVINDRFAKLDQLTLYLGCYNTSGNNIYYSINDIIEDFYDNGKIGAAITLTGIPEKVEAGLDYTNVDDKGYPKAGWIAIKKMHIADPYSSFANTFSHP